VNINKIGFIGKSLEFRLKIDNFINDKGAKLQRIHSAILRLSG